MRRSSVLIYITAISMTLLAAIPFHASLRAEQMKVDTELRAEMVRELGLSDLCLFTEARYTRHPSAADMNTAFQDHPLSLEHFP